MNLEVENELRVYYRSILPVEAIFRVLDITPRREVAFFTGSGTYLRYQTFDSVDAFREKLSQISPVKLDLGSYYDIPPTKQNGARPVARELVFDIDLTDYPRDCCQDKNICEKCYVKIKAAVKMLDFILYNELGFRKYGFVFSGRRGVHCWVLEMKEMPAHVRNDIFKYFHTVVDKNMPVVEYKTVLQEFGKTDVIKNLFPRLDKQVTVSMNHLLKMPFSVHPDTLNISVPIDPNEIPELADIPTLSEIVARPERLSKYVEIFQRWR